MLRGSDHRTESMPVTVDETLRDFERVAADWRPLPVDAEDVITAEPAKRFAALLDVASPVAQQGDPLPPLWHRFYFLPIFPQASLGPDGHPVATRLTPPIGEHRRVFGGCRVSFHRPVRCGDRVQRRSEVVGVRATVGRTGPLLIVTIRHTCAVDDEAHIVEEHDLLYRAPLAGTPASSTLQLVSDNPPVADGPWTLSILPDPVLLFRYSALAHNAHRIHYDLPYARDVEGHAGLVVQGLLLALLMLELPRRHAPDHRVETLRWAANASLYAGQRIFAYGRPAGHGAELAVGHSAAPRAITGTVTFAS